MPVQVNDDFSLSHEETRDEPSHKTCKVTPNFLYIGVSLFFLRVVCFLARTCAQTQIDHPALSYSRASFVCRPHRSRRAQNQCGSGGKGRTESEGRAPG